jgi:integral membrane protein
VEDSGRSPAPGGRSGIGVTFAVAAAVEAVTWAGLLVGMFLKYVTDTTEAGVHLFGRLHGVAFIVYVLAVLIAGPRLRWGWRTTAVALLASVPPLTTLVFEAAARRRGLLVEPVAEPVELGQGL